MGLITTTSLRVSCAGALGMAVCLGVLSPLGSTAAVGAAGTLSFQDPAADGPVRAGTVELRGSVAGTSPAETVSVMYLVDVSGSTIEQRNQDCNGSGSVTPADDINGDTVVGDILDCEVAGVLGLNKSLGRVSGTTVQVGLELFAGEAVVAATSSAGAGPFVAPAATGENGLPQMATIARSLRRLGVQQWVPKSVAEGTNFDAAISTVLTTLSQAPAGPKWVFLLSDGGDPSAPKNVPPSPNALDALTASGVHLRSFAVGASSGCTPSYALAQLAEATGETCVAAAQPSRLAANVTGSQPDDVDKVEVAIGGVTVVADVDPIGTWRASVRLGQGDYTATATAFMRSGQTLTASRSFKVLQSLSGASPAPGTVAPAAGTLLATRLAVHRPKPSRAALPATVTGTVRLPGTRAGATPGLDGSRVVLQGTKTNGQTWVRLARTTATGGTYSMHWKRLPGFTRLRVVLPEHGRYAAAVTLVPFARISACHVARASDRWTVSCRTTAGTGSKARMLRDGTVIDRGVVSLHRFRLSGTGRVHGHVIQVEFPHGRARLVL